MELWAGGGATGGATRRGRGYEEGAGLRGGGGAGHLLAQQVVVHLQALRLLEGLLQALVALPQLPHVVARLGQDPAFALGCGAETSVWGFLGALATKLPRNGETPWAPSPPPPNAWDPKRGP